MFFSIWLLVGDMIVNVGYFCSGGLLPTSGSMGDEFELDSIVAVDDLEEV